MSKINATQLGEWILKSTTATELHFWSDKVLKLVPHDTQDRNIRYLSQFLRDLACTIELAVETKAAPAADTQTPRDIRVNPAHAAPYNLSSEAKPSENTPHSTEPREAVGKLMFMPTSDLEAMIEIRDRLSKQGVDLQFRIYSSPMK